LWLWEISVPLVFVHGVSVRDGAPYAENQKTRDGLFRKFALKKFVPDTAKVRIENPYWGQFGANPAWNGASLPDGKYESFGSTDGVFEEILVDLASDIQAPSQDKVLVTLARLSLPRAIDCLWAAGAFTDSGSPAGDALAEQSVRALEYAAADSRPKWLDNVSDDDAFVEKLLTELDAFTPQKKLVESFGVSDIWNHLKTAVTHIANSATALLTNPAARAIRPWVNSRVMLFLGDIFVYLKSRDATGGGPIVAEVQGAFERADKARNPDDDKLIVVAHSMGGNISYDILTSFAPNIQVDLFLTVGSQVGLFEELKLYKNSNATVKAPTHLPKPANIKKWINVMDLSDVLAYATSPIFDKSLDTKIDNHVPVWSAHTVYFYRPTFHQRLQARLQEL
jgi:hypothetical protein